MNHEIELLGKKREDIKGPLGPVTQYVKRGTSGIEENIDRIFGIKVSFESVIRQLKPQFYSSKNLVEISDFAWITEI